MRNLVANQLGLLRSLAIYYAPGRVSRLARFYAPFIRPGDLCFDLGAHVGNRVAAWKRLGARVVAVEPQAHLMAWLRWLYGKSETVELVEKAVGSSPDTRRLYHDPSNPTVTTLSREWIDTVSVDPSFARVRWRAAEYVPVTTLDDLIAAYGRPALCKIDIEGFEAEALRGLSAPLPLVSFEYIPAAIAIARACVARLGELGEYEFNWYAGESYRWAAPQWLDASTMDAQLERLGSQSRSGDIVARLISVA